jgi:predicted nucleotidyltransferase
MKPAHGAVSTGPAQASLSLERIAAAIARDPSDIVVMSGSRQEGFGNARSDYDIYVVTADDRTHDAGKLIVPVGDVYLDYQAYTRSQLLDIADSLAATDPADLPAVSRLPLATLDAYYRFLIAAPILNEPEFARLQVRFAKTCIDALVQSWCGVRAAARLDEATRLLALGQPTGAYIAAQKAAAAATDSFLASRGESFPSFKWRFEKLRRCVAESDPMYQRPWSLKALGTRSIEEYVQEVVSFCGDAGVGRYQAWSLDDVVYRTAPTARLLEIASVTYLVMNKSTLFELTAPGNAVWRSIDGVACRRDVVARAVADGAMSERGAEAFLFDLVDRGLIL